MQDKIIIVEEVLGTDEGAIFEVEDYFNPGNILSGFICYKPDRRYGSLVILKVNEEETKQLILATPKLHYPFDKQGTYKWPKVDEVKIWDKLDGTNIFSYRYSYKGKEYITYKSRLTPVVKDSGFVAFRTLWIEYMDENPWVSQLIVNNPQYNLSFELYGSRNPITIKYESLLEVSLLFGVRRTDGAIKPPDQLNLPKDCKLPQSFGVISGIDSETLTRQYNSVRSNMSEKNKEDLYIEGTVWYAHVGEPSWRMFKCKPEEIEKIHWAASGSIPILSLRNTAINVFEDKDNPTIQDFETLLLEEYTRDMINKAMPKIHKAWNWTVDHITLTKSVNDVWTKAKEAGFNVAEDKNATMRFISQYFSKKDMGKVGTIILKQAGLLKEKEKKHETRSINY